MHGTTPPGSNPPVDLTSFVGRVREMAALRRLAPDSRLITLTGAGGSGKSRLARQLLPHLGDRGSAAVWVELAPVTDADMVPTATLRAVDPSAEPGGAPQELLQDLLRSGRKLLVLDNCEHLVDACAEMVDSLLRACPDLSILATSREALGVPGERAWLVPPMEVPGSNAGAVRVADSDAARLFADRARDMAPDFEITEQNAAAVADICRQLDGIPLAIELAASRVRVMTPEQIRDRLGDAFSLLTSRARTVLPRHRTLRAALDWSHDLLPDEARTVFRRLSVFRSGFTLDAAEAVAAGAGIESGDVLDLVAMLVDRSLLTMREHGDSARYHLLETTRQYARQKLAGSGEEEQAQRAMAAFFVDLVAEVEPDFVTTRRREAFSRLDPEVDNIREVLEWTHANDAAAHVRLAGMMWWYWYTSRYWLEARRWLDGALALGAADGPSRDRAAVLFASGALSSLQAQVPQAREHLEQAVTMASAMGNARLEAYALNYLGMVYGQVGDPVGAEYSARAEGWFRANDDAYGLRLALLLKGMGIAAAGDTVGARAFIEEAVSIARRFGQDRELGIALQTLAGVVLDMGDEAAAERLVAESLDALRRDWSYLFLGRGCELLAISVRNRDPLHAARLIGAGHGLRTLVGAKRFRLDEMRMQPVIQQLQESLGAQYDACFADGASRPHDLISAAAVAADAVEAPAAPQKPAVQAAPPSPSSAPADLSVRLLGGFRVSVSGSETEPWRYAKPKELLALMLAHPRGRTRSEIGAALWPDATAAQVRNSFHVTMHHLRKSLGHADWVVIDGERYRISPDISVECDATEFERLVRRASSVAGDERARCLADAMSLYSDHYLAGEVAGGWRDDEQDRLRGLYAEAGLRLGALLHAEGRHAEAAAVYERLLLHEPLLEEAHRRLMSHWAATGDRARAIRHYERLAARLSVELELEPDDETTALYESVRSGESQSPLSAS